MDLMAPMACATYVNWRKSRIWPGILMWKVHQDLQINRVADLGLARDPQWLGGRKNHWLLQSPTMRMSSRCVEHDGLAIAPDARLVRKTAVNGRRWVCDPTMTHCIPSADESVTLVTGRSTDEENAP